LGLLLPGVIISFGAFLAWVKLYPEDYDPKNIEYVLWTYGLNQNMNLDDAVPGMTRDNRTVRVVKGMSKEQLKSRFGYIRTADATTPYFRGCNES